MKNISIAGSGVLGTQIAFQAAFRGYEVTLYDISSDVLEKAAVTLTRLGECYATDIAAAPEQIAQARGRITMTDDLGTALADADLLIEAIPEIVDIKLEFYRRAAAVAPAKTIFATNTSTFMPSQFADATGRPDKFVALHFANEIWKRNTAEVMGHAGTDRVTFDAVIAFADSIGMITLPIYKEQPGYIVNSLAIPFATAALKLWADEVADFKSIDKCWMVATGGTFAPFALVDMGGMNTAYNLCKNLADVQGDQLMEKAAHRIHVEFIEQGKLGVATGEGFYTYPNPEYLRPDFLS